MTKKKLDAKLKLMKLSVSTVVAIITLLISISATYNAFLLRGGKFAWSQVLIVLAMIYLMLSMVLDRFLPKGALVGSATYSDILFVLGFVLLLIASVRLNSALK